MNTMHVKKGDTVIVLSGKDRGKQGKVLMAIPSEQKVIAEGINVVTKHAKPRRQGEVGGLIKKEAPIYACKVMAVCKKCKKPTRPAYQILGNGEKVRICKHCGETL
jgi:large subunit ribosomal protein L24